MTYPDRREASTEDLYGRYVTRAVESGVFGADGDLLGHVGLIDMDEVALADAVDVARRLRGDAVVLRSSERCYHVWCLAVRSLDRWLHDLDRLDGLDPEHVSLSLNRETMVLRTERKTALDNARDSTVAPRPSVRRMIRDDISTVPHSRPHLRVLVEELDVPIRTDIVDSRRDVSEGRHWIGDRVERRVFTAAIGGGR